MGGRQDKLRADDRPATKRLQSQTVPNLFGHLDEPKATLLRCSESSFFMTIPATQGNSLTAVSVPPTIRCLCTVDWPHSEMKLMGLREPPQHAPSIRGFITANFACCRFFLLASFCAGGLAVESAPPGGGVTGGLEHHPHLGGLGRDGDQPAAAEPGRKESP